MSYSPDTRIANAVREVVTRQAGQDWPTRDVYHQVIGLAERPLITETLKLCGGNLSRCAWVLGINRNTLRAKARRHGVRV